MATRKPSGGKPAARRSAAKAAARVETPLLEWISAGIGLVVTLGLVGVIGWEALNADPSPPAVTVEAFKTTPTAAGYVVEVRVTNRGGSPAAQVIVEGELQGADGETETAEATFDYVPDHSSREGGLVFEADPRGGRLSLRAKGYAAP